MLLIVPTVANEQPFTSLAITLTGPAVLVTNVLLVNPWLLKLYWYEHFLLLQLPLLIALPVPQDNGVVAEMVAETTTGSAIVIAAAARKYILLHP
jgi:hypothetical protein